MKYKENFLYSFVFLLHHFFFFFWFIFLVSLFIILLHSYTCQQFKSNRATECCSAISIITSNNNKKQAVTMFKFGKKKKFKNEIFISRKAVKQFILIYMYIKLIQYNLYGKFLFLHNSFFFQFLIIFKYTNLISDEGKKPYLFGYYFDFDISNMNTSLCIRDSFLVFFFFEKFPLRILCIKFR